MSTFADLCREWASLAHSPATTRDLARWGSSDPILGRFTTMAELVTFVERRGSPGASDAVLAALARRAPDDQLAARALLQLLLPALCGLARRHRWIGDVDERAQTVVAVAYERIRTYPFERRPHRIAANVVWDTTQRLLAERERHRRQPPLAGREGPGECVAPTPGESATEELLELLSWARRHGHLSPQAIRLIALTRVADVAPAQLVPEFGSDPSNVRRRRNRAEWHLRAVAAA
ncbi:MAG: hypothetical protein Q8K72_12220 [Acidimicrobiales bacterium]|nr:hypothetical protein [Acidimicrobiales bacterium]